MSNYVAGGVGKAIMFLGNRLWGVGSTLTDNTFNFSITGDEIRGGKKNMLLAQYFHDSALAITLTNALFNFEDISLALGLQINDENGLSLKEEQVTAVGNNLTVTETPIAFNGQKIGWYKKPTETEWKIGNFSEKTMSPQGGFLNGDYCVKYFWNNPDARWMNLRADYEPSEIHLVILQDLFATEERSGEIVPGAKAGTLITDIPRFKPNGSQDLSFTATGTGTTSLTGNALAVVDNSKCGETYSYGTMTEEIYNVSWKDRVSAIAIENADVELEQSGTETLAVRVLFKDGSVSQQKANSDFTFMVEKTPTATATQVAVGKNTGIVTAGSTNGAAVISVELTGYEDVVEPAYAHVTVA